MIHDFTSAELEKQLTSKEIVFIEFFAVWCGPCKTLKPIFEKISFEFKNKALFYQLNIDEHKNIAIQYKISSIPTIICLKKGIPCWTHTGTIAEATLREKVNSLLI